MVDYEELIEKARKRVASIEEPYRGLAFQVILQDLIRRAESIQPQPSVSKKKAKTEEKKLDPVEAFMQQAIDVSAYTPLFSKRGYLVEKSLAILLLARDEFGIDGMKAGEIAQVLTRKFRVQRVHAQNISRDLGSRTDLISRIRTGTGYTYLLMLGGENHLQKTISELSP